MSRYSVPVPHYKGNGFVDLHVRRLQLASFQARLAVDRAPIEETESTFCVEKETTTTTTENGKNRLIVRKFAGR